MVERLRRLEWLFERSPIYFVTTCTQARRPILAQPFVQERLRQFAESGPERGAWMGAYVIMPDHLHLFVALNPTAVAAVYDRRGGAAEGGGKGEDGDGRRAALQGDSDAHRAPLQGDGDGRRPPLQLGDWMKSLKNALSKVLRENGVEAPHWQKGYFDHVLRGGESYAEKWEYVRENPVRAGFVARWEDWPYRGEPFDLEFRRDRG